MSKDLDNEPGGLITLQLDTGERTFEDLDELRDWAKEERQAFSWLQAATKNQGAIQPSWTALNTCIGKVEAFCKQFEQQNEQQRQNATKEVQTHFRNHVNAGKYISRESAHAAFVFTLRGTDNDSVAAHAFAFLANQDFPVATRHSYMASHKTMAYLESQSPETADAQIEALESVKKSWSIKFGKLFSSFRDDSNSVKEEISGLRGDFGSLVNDIETEKGKQETNFTTLCDEAKGELQEIAQTYDEKLALQSSVTYWGEKKKSHNIVMWCMGGLTIFTAFGTGAAFVWVGHKFFQGSLESIQIWHLGIPIAISTFGVWLTRLFGKIFISNLHLRTDAEERVTMILTYLAMLREGTAVKDEERELILKVIFRPSTSGYIKEEGPTGLSELATAILRKK